MPLQKNSISELHDQFLPCPKVEKYAEAKTHCTWQKNELSAGIKWEGTSIFKRFLKKKIILFRLALGSMFSFRKHCNG